MRLWLVRCLVCDGQALFHNGRRGICGRCAKPHALRLNAIRAPALYAVAIAIRAGHLPKLDGKIKCVDCGKKAQVYDHREYAKPLDVAPVCLSCNSLRGPAKETAAIVVRLPINFILRPPA
jgi:hypothetical protein